MKIPIYFNYIENTFPQLLEDAVNSITHEKLEVHVSRHVKPKPFTQCLNAIQKECLQRGDKYWMFMHCDAEILDDSIVDMMIDRYENPVGDEKIASVCACTITDLLILFDTDKIEQLGGWDEKFNNSYMEYDLRHRIISNKMSQPILYKMDCPTQISHKESSSLRNKNKKGSLMKVYSQTYESDIRRYYSMYSPSVNMDKHAGLIKWKKYIGDDGAEFQKKELNMVFSVGKTASTTIYRSWAIDVNKLPVCHTHCLNWFSVIDLEDSVFMQNMRINFKNLIFFTSKSSYVPDGCIEIKFNLKNGVTFGDVFPNLLFDCVNVVTLTRDPVSRRISQFLNTLTCESLNSALDSMSGETKSRNIDPTSNILTQLKTFQDDFKKPGTCQISRILTNMACDENRLANEDDLVTIFKNMLIGTELNEYNWLFHRIKLMMGVTVLPSDILKHGYSIQYGSIDYSKVDPSLKDSNSIDVNSIVFKMENFSEPNVTQIMKDFTGIKNILHSRNISKEVPIVGVDLVKMKNVLRNAFNMESLYRTEASQELSLVKSIGY